MKQAMAALVLTAAALCGSAAYGQSQREIKAPDWEETPDADAVSRYFPNLANRLGLNGYAVITCDVNVQGRLTGCAVVTEAPRDLGFGAAAVSMSSIFKMRPKTLHDIPVDGGTVRIPLRFTAPFNDPAVEPPEAQSAAAMNQALRMIDAADMVASTRKWNEAVHRRDKNEGVPEASVDTATAALDAAWAARGDDLRNAYARAAASVFSVEEMAGITDFASGPGMALRDNADLGKAFAAIYQDRRRGLRGPALEAYCGKQPCPSPVDLARVWRARPDADGLLDAPQWTRMPGEAAMRRVAPTVAGAIGLSGAVRLTCGIELSGNLKDCKVEEELPVGHGYAEAALSLVGSYRISAIQLKGGEPVRRATVRVGFEPPTLGDRYKPAVKLSEASKALAGKLSPTPEDLQPARRDIEVEIVGLQSKLPPGAQQKLNDALIDAYRVGAYRALEESQQQVSLAIAAQLSEGQLAALVDYRSSPAGKAETERAQALAVAYSKAADFVGQKVASDARAVYCRVRDCTPPPVTAPHPTSTNPAPSTRKP